MKYEGFRLPAHTAAREGLIGRNEVFWVVNEASGQRVRVRHRRWFGEENVDTIEDAKTGRPLHGCLVPVLAGLDAPPHGVVE